MEFSNLFFLYIFLPLTIAAYFLMPQMRGKNYVLIAASLIFYAMGQPCYLPLLLLTAYINYAMAYRVQEGSRAILAAVVGGNLAVLLLFKILGQFTSVALPIGVSFYTFQLVSYQVDVFRGKTRPAQYFSKLLLYVSMFPKMVMGPIVRYEQVERQLERRKTNPKAIFEGMIRFVVGLAKKVLIADYAYSAYDQLSKQAFGGAAWLGALMFMFYIYFEFSGCTDMAIGLGRVFGFRYAENFDVPYASSSITEFWRRWHITLGSFFRDYVYIPLGGNRKGRARQILNLLVVWALTGLWHGTSMNFILWGLYFFVLLAIEKQIMPKLERMPFALRNLFTMFFVLIGWVLFAHENMAELGNTFAMMFGKGAFWSGSVTVILKNSVPLLLLCLLGSSVLPKWFAAIWSILLVRQKKQNRFSLLQTLHAVSLFLFAALLLYLCTASLVGASSKPSLYASF